jgi:hypothetical protein
MLQYLNILHQQDDNSFIGTMIVKPRIKKTVCAVLIVVFLCHDHILEMYNRVYSSRIRRYLSNRGQRKWPCCITRQRLYSFSEREQGTCSLILQAVDMKPLTGAATEQTLKWMETEVLYDDEDEFDKCITFNAEAMKNETSVFSSNWGNTFKCHLEFGTHLEGGCMGVS